MAASAVKEPCLHQGELKDCGGAYRFCPSCQETLISIGGKLVKAGDYHEAQARKGQK